MVRRYDHPLSTLTTLGLAVSTTIMLLPGTSRAQDTAHASTGRAEASAQNATGLPQASTQATDGQRPVSDIDITFAVEDALLFDALVPAQVIDVTTQEGTVTLTGAVNTLRAKDRAVRIAQTVRGVRAVIDRIDIRAVPRADSDIREDVERALLLDPATDSYEVTPVVTNGTVLLTGTVDSWQEKELAVTVAKGVRGVRDVEEDIDITYDMTRADSAIHPEVERALQVDPLINAARYNVRVDDGTVHLSGTAGSVAEIRRARSVAWVGGVKAVDASAVTVEPWAERPARAFDRDLRSDESIRRAVEDALRYDPRVSAFTPVVTVSSGVVTLSGVVDNLKARKAAEEDARNTVGVWRVRNYLKVRPTSAIADSTIVENVEMALGFNPITERNEIDVASYGGFVTLTGTVDSFVEKSEAEDVAMRTNGVIDVTNALTVRDPSLTAYAWEHLPFYRPAPDTAVRAYRSDAEILDDIQDELFWSPFVDSDEVTVTVTNGIATLSGTVDSWAEFRAAAENAREGGARSVINRLEVQ